MSKKNKSGVKVLTDKEYDEYIASLCGEDFKEIDKNDKHN